MSRVHKILDDASKLPKDLEDFLDLVVFTAFEAKLHPGKEIEIKAKYDSGEIVNRPEDGNIPTREGDFVRYGLKGTAILFDDYRARPVNNIIPQLETVLNEIGINAKSNELCQRSGVLYIVYTPPLDSRRV